MAADAGDDILLSYGPQGEQQAGDDILLSYTNTRPRRRLVATFQGRWGKATAAHIDLQAPHGAVQPADREWDARWSRGRSQDAEQAQPWGTTAPLDLAARSPWPSFGRALQREPRMPWRGAAARDVAADMTWPGFQGKADRATAHPWSPALAKDVQSGAPWGGPMRPHAVALLALVPRAKRLDRDRYLPWSRYSRQLAPGWGIVTPPNPLPEPGETVILPVRGYNIVINEVFLTRVDTGDVIPALSMSFQLDVDSRAWEFSANIRKRYLHLLEPDSEGPVELEAMVNGVAFRVLVDDPSSDRTFETSSVSINGKGLSALLGPGYAPQLSFGNTEARTMAQLADEALLLNGVPVGWTVNWALPDWLVPAGIWSFQGSHIEAVARLAEAAGAYICPDPLTQTLTVAHRYPTMPWEWADATPDFVLPAGRVTKESIQWQQRARYDGVYVSGTHAGYTALVKRAGVSTPSRLAPMVTEPLLTGAEGNRQRGRAVLGQTGRVALVGLQMRVLEETGVILPGPVIRYTDPDTSVVRSGLARSVRVDVRGVTSVSQTIGVETYVS